MSDEAAFLNVITAHPEEDTPRLVYADWLDEHADALPNPVVARARAELIRLQIETALIRPFNKETRYFNRHLFERCDELVAAHRDELLGPVMQLTDVWDRYFWRGFPVVKLRDDSFLRQTAAITAMRPRPRVEVMSGYEFLGFTAPLACADADLSLVNTIFAEWTTDLEPIIANAAFYPRTWPQLELLSAHCQLGDANVASLVGESWYPALMGLSLSTNKLTDKAVEFILDSGLPPQLKSLDLDWNDITDVGALTLAARWPTGDADHLEHLSLGYNYIGDTGYQALYERFPHCLNMQ